MKLPDGGKLVSWTGFIFGTAVSVAANVLAARIPPDKASTDWAPRIDTQLGSAVWPLALLLSIEVLARVAWPKGIWWGIARFGGLSIVASGAFAISYQHINHVLASWGYEWLSQGVGPLVIDGLMIICGVAMLAKPGVLKKLLVGKDAPEIKTEVVPPKMITEFKPSVITPLAPVENTFVQARQEVNGHRVSAALKTGPKAPARRPQGQTTDEIIAILRAERGRGENPNLTKVAIMSRFSVGAAKWSEIKKAMKVEEA